MEAPAPAEVFHSQVTVVQKRILLLGWQTTIGSGVLAIPAIRAVQAHFGSTYDLWLLTRPVCPGASHPADLLAAWVGLRGVLSMPRLRDLPGWFRLIRQVRRLRFDHVIYVDLSRPRQRARRILPFLCKIAGLGRPLGFPRTPVPAIPPKRHEAAGRLANLAADGINAPALAVMPRLPIPPHEEADLWLAAHRRPGRRLVALCPGARASANHWPLDRFMALGAALLARGDCDVVVCGGPAEREVGQSLRERWGAGLVTAGEFDLAGTARLLAHCDLVVGLDTGTSHLAAALGIPVIVLQGARTWAGMWDPLGPAVTVLRLDLPCAGCGLMRCPLAAHPCMRGITLSAVWQAVERVLPSPGAS
ncbi:glycosyltransferase family 9 protein [Oleisolibacter albus]|uniref:glycosyltransferase family 9 protein n=1 Tax=Oleisolibacter albus TaxID=2171757 RepID=UPI0012D7B9BA|nr:glycosyltransferase family 9 protein [Oleisolibacter albus]